MIDKTDKSGPFGVLIHCNLSQYPSVVDALGRVADGGMEAYSVHRPLASAAENKSVPTSFTVPFKELTLFQPPIGRLSQPVSSPVHLRLKFSVTLLTFFVAYSGYVDVLC